MVYDPFHNGVKHEKEEKSKKIAHCKVKIDYESLDANLQALYEACIDKIIASEFFELKD